VCRAEPAHIRAHCHQLARRACGRTAWGNGIDGDSADGDLDFDQVSQLCKRKVNSFDELTMGDYQQVLSNPEMWTKLGWPLDRQTFIERLDEIRKIRNGVMHFNPDPPPAGTIDKLRKLNSVLRRYGQLA
jgi:hypothetical protein